ncbi:pentatricopeptide repeat-containing protein At5g13770, chloroplastic [Nymphaea colorata]|nr:pentatricopeptide repeat-containing protein At5g13770, chloroplastic [Nymphaea colorata]
MAVAYVEHPFHHLYHPPFRLGISSLTTATFVTLSRQRLSRKDGAFHLSNVVSACGSPSVPILDDSANAIPAAEVRHLHAEAGGSGARQNFGQRLQDFLRQEPNEESVLDFYREAKKDPNFFLDFLSTNFLISFLTKSEQWRNISEIAPDIGICLAFPGSSTGSKAVRLCISSRKFRVADALLDSLAKNRRTAAREFASAMKGYNELHMYGSTVSLYDRMVSFGIEPDFLCYRLVLEALEKSDETDKAARVFEEIRSRGLGSSSEAKSIYLAFCRTLVQSGRATQGVELVREMESSGVEPDHRFYACLIPSLVAEGRPKEAEALLSESLAKRHPPKDQTVFLRLVSLRVDSDSPEKAMEIVAAAKNSGVMLTDCVLSVVVGGHARRRGPRAALEAFDQLTSLGLRPGQVTYSMAVGACARLGLTARAESLLVEMQASGYGRCVFAYAIVIRLYGREGRSGDALRMLGVMKAKGCRPNVWVYNALLDVYGRDGNVRQAERLWNEMRARKVRPDRASYTSLIGAYARVKDYEACVRVYSEFKGSGGRLDRTLAAVMVGVLSKSTRVDQLIRFLGDVKDHGVGLDARLYRSTLYALKDAGLQAQLKRFLQSFGTKAKLGDA